MSLLRVQVLSADMGTCWTLSEQRGDGGHSLPCLLNWPTEDKNEGHLLIMWKLWPYLKVWTDIRVIRAERHGVVTQTLPVAASREGRGVEERLGQTRGHGLWVSLRRELGEIGEDRNQSRGDGAGGSSKMPPVMLRFQAWRDPLPWAWPVTGS